MMLGTALAKTCPRDLAAIKSFAAAIAEAGMGLAGGWAAGCWALADRDENARASAMPVASKIPDEPFILFLLNRRHHGRSTTRIPWEPASIAVLARPMNSPCSTTPGMELSDCARRGAFGMRPRWTSTIQWPPSVTKT